MHNTTSFKKYLVALFLCLVTSAVFSQQYRYIRIQKSGTNTNGNAINLAEIQAIDIDGATNRSLTGTATLSTHYGGGGGFASYGNDDDLNGNWGGNSVTHTGIGGTNEWWEIDLGASYDLSKINIYNRTDCCSERLSDMYVMASNTPFDGDATGNNPASLTAALENAGFTYQFGTIASNATQLQDFSINTISTGTITPTAYTAGDPMSIPYTKTEIFTTGNVFTAQLSDATGSFASPTDIGTLTSIANGTISATIPSATPTGSSYRVRVIGSNTSTLPAVAKVLGTININDLTITNTLGVDDEILSTFNLYPNPVTTNELKLTIPYEIEEFDISIFSILGQELYAEKNKNNYNKIHTVSTLNFKPGIYFIAISTENGKATKKLIID